MVIELSICLSSPLRCFEKWSVVTSVEKQMLSGDRTKHLFDFATEVTTDHSSKHLSGDLKQMLRSITARLSHHNCLLDLPVPTFQYHVRHQVGYGPWI